MGSAVLLLHALPDLSWHYDLMVEPPRADPLEGLITWRLCDRIDRRPLSCVGIPLARHRAAYLTYEGSTSSGRGTVRQIARGQADWLDASRIRLMWARAGSVYSLRETLHHDGVLTEFRLLR